MIHETTIDQPANNGLAPYTVLSKEGDFTQIIEVAPNKSGLSFRVNVVFASYGEER